MNPLLQTLCNMPQALWAEELFAVRPSLRLGDFQSAAHPDAWNAYTGSDWTLCHHPSMAVQLAGLRQMCRPAPADLCISAFKLGCATFKGYSTKERQLLTISFTPSRPWALFSLQGLPNTHDQIWFSLHPFHPVNLDLHASTEICQGSQVADMESIPYYA